MAKHRFRIIDAEMHVMEPVDLWERYTRLLHFEGGVAHPRLVRRLHEARN